MSPQTQQAYRSAAGYTIEGLDQAIKDLDGNPEPFLIQRKKELEDYRSTIIEDLENQ